MILALLSLAWLLLAAIWWDMEHQIRRMDAALRASAYLDRVLPAPPVHEVELRYAPFNADDVAWLHAAEGRGTYLAEADAVTILMGRATATEEE